MHPFPRLQSSPMVLDRLLVEPDLGLSLRMFSGAAVPSAVSWEKLLLILLCNAFSLPLQLVPPSSSLETWAALSGVLVDPVDRTPQSDTDRCAVTKKNPNVQRMQ